MALVTVTESYLEDIADAIRSKNGSSNTYTPAQMADAISAISGGGIDPSDATATNAHILYPKTAYVATGKVTGAIQTKSESDITVSGSVVTAPAGYYETAASGTVGAGSVTAPSLISATGATVSTSTNTLALTKNVSVTPSVTTAGWITAGTAGTANVSLYATVPIKSATTHYATSSITTAVSSGTYCSGSVSVAAVTTSNLAAGNIRGGVVVKVGDSADDDRIATVTGTFTNDATASASDIVSGKMAYASGASVSGSLVIQHYYTGTTTPASSLGVNGDIYLKTS